MAHKGLRAEIFTVDPHRNVRIKPLRAPRLVRRNDPVVKVTLETGAEIVCTPDHRFMLRDGTYREAQELRFNDSLMPIYRRWQTRDGYESVSTGKGTARLTHILVYEALYGPVPGLARLRQPLHRGQPGRAGPGLAVPALRVARGRQQAGHPAHQGGPGVGLPGQGSPRRPGHDRGRGGQLPRAYHHDHQFFHRPGRA